MVFWLFTLRSQVLSQGFWERTTLISKVTESGLGGYTRRRRHVSTKCNNRVYYTVQKFKIDQIKYN